MPATDDRADIPSPAPRVRPATEHDAPGVATIYNEWVDDHAGAPAASSDAAADALAADRPAHSSRLPRLTDGHAREWLAVHRSIGCPVWVLERESAVLGWLSFFGNWGRPGFAHCAEIALYVARAARRSAVGRTLLAHAIDRAPAHGIDRLIALVWHDNRPSLALFEGMGFERWGCMPQVVWAHGRSHDMLTLGARWCRLDPPVPAWRRRPAVSDEKTEEPTDKKLRDARQQGQVTKSQDLALALNLGGMTLLLSAGGAWTFDRLSAIVQRSLAEVPRVGDFTHLRTLMLQLTLDAAMAVAPFVGASVLLGVLSNMGQTGVLLSFEAVSLKFEKLNPAEGIKNLVSMKSLVEVAKSIVKAVVLAWVLWVLIRDLTPLLVGSAYLEPASIGRIAFEAVLKLMFAAVVLFLVIGPVDYGIQRWLFLKDQRMSKDEIKREHKDMEGDPEIKQKRKQIAQEMSEAPPEKTVPGASVVVTNPTHYAVALRYEAGETPLPIVVAKGMDAEALRIRRIAEEHGIPTVQDPPLARALHKLRVNDAVPESLFEAVAAVLRWVMVVRSVGASAATTQRPT